jgi:hypothetical protein
VHFGAYILEGLAVAVFLILGMAIMNAHTVRGRWKQVVEALVRVFIVSVALPVGLLPWVHLGACP